MRQVKYWIHSEYYSFWWKETLPVLVKVGLRTLSLYSNILVGQNMQSKKHKTPFLLWKFQKDVFPRLKRRCSFLQDYTTPT